MTTTHRTRAPRPRHVVGGGLALLTLLALTGCSGSSAAGSTSTPSTPAPTPTSAAPATSTPTPAPSSAAPSTASTPGTPAPTPTAGAAARSVGTCATRDLAVSLLPGDGEAGSSYYTVVLRNRSDHACRTRGFGGVSLVGGGDGAQVGAAADRDTSSPVHRVLLRPGGRAEATLRVVQAQNYPRGRCRPEAVDGLRVYPPDQTRSAYVAQALTGCRSAGVHLLTISAYRPGT